MAYYTVCLIMLPHVVLSLVLKLKGKRIKLTINTVMGWKPIDSNVFTLRSLLRMGYCRHGTRTYVRTYIRTSVIHPKFFLRFLVFWDPHVGSSWRFFHFLKKMIFWACHALFLTIFLIYKGLLGARCKSGDLCWKGFVCRFWIYIVVRPDLFFAFLKKAFVSPAD